MFLLVISGGSAENRVCVKGHEGNTGEDHFNGRFNDGLFSDFAYFVLSFLVAMASPDYIVIVSCSVGIVLSPQQV